MCLPGGVRSWHGKGGYNDQRKIEYHAPFLHTKIRNGSRRNTPECSILRFDEPGEAWLDFVSDNRSGKYEGEAYDFIFGPVANDDVYRTFTLYTAGVLTKEQTLEQLKIKKLYNQLVLTTEKALSYLRFAGTVPEEEF